MTRLVSRCKAKVLVKRLAAGARGGAPASALAAERPRRHQPGWAPVV
jgi:hypothetical protein